MLRKVLVGSALAMLCMGIAASAEENLGTQMGKKAVRGAVNLVTGVV